MRRLVKAPSYFLDLHHFSPRVACHETYLIEPLIGLEIRIGGDVSPLYRDDVVVFPFGYGVADALVDGSHSSGVDLASIRIFPSVLEV